MAPRSPIRWWPAIVIAVLAVVCIIWVRMWDDLPFQQRNIQTAQVCILAGLLTILWWVFFSRACAWMRVRVALTAVGIIGVTAGLFRIRGVSGDLVPILEPRWATRDLPVVPVAADGANSSAGDVTPGAEDFPQFLGPDRNGILPRARLNPDWKTSPPQVVWRQEVGAAWSGFSVVSGRAYTQEQRGEQESVTCYDAATGRLLWIHQDKARYNTVIAGEGPRATPTVVDGRVLTFGGTGRLNCLNAATGERLWAHDIKDVAGTKVPDWGYASSPLVVEGRALVSAGGANGRSLLAFNVEDGELVWTGGDDEASYGSPALVRLAGVEQVLAFNAHFITAHAPDTGRVLWEHPWGVGYPHVAMPIPVGDTRVLFTSGYGVGAQLIELATTERGNLQPKFAWKSNRLKAKFSNPVLRDGHVYGLDDGILVCIDVGTGELKWKEGRYGHGQGLLLGEHYLLMSEQGELVLLHPTPEAPNELGTFKVFSAKTWNPIALSGDLLLVRNDQEAACVRLKLAD